MPINGALFGGVQIGDYAFGVPESSFNVVVEQIPRASGVVIKHLGGGIQNIIVNGWVVDSISRIRKRLEEYLRDLGSRLQTQSPTDLTINGVTYSDCFFVGIFPGGSNRHFDTFTATFTRSATGTVC